MGNINPAEEAAQLNYFARERQAANELLGLQISNAQKLAALRQSLNNNLNSSMLSSGKATEEYLANYGLQQRLNALDTEMNATRAAREGNEAAIVAIRNNAASQLAASETNLGRVRLQMTRDAVNAQVSGLNTASAMENDIAASRIDTENQTLSARLSGISMSAEAERSQQAQTYQQRLNQIRAAGNDEMMLRAQANDEWAREYLQQETARQQSQMKMQQSINSMMMSMGATMDQVMDLTPLETRLDMIAAEQTAKIEAAKAAGETDFSSIEAEYAYRAQKEIELEEMRQEATAIALKQQGKQQLKSARDAAKALASQSFGTTTQLLNPAHAQREAERLMAEEGMSEEDAKQQVAQAKGEALKAMITDILDQLAAQGRQIASAQTMIDTRLQGTSDDNINRVMGSYWRRLESDITKGVGVSPFVKQEAVVENLKTLVGKGISFNIEQRAFLQTISEKIANTFEAADGTLLRLVRIQQADTTAARLGMESALTSFLNSMYETSEYMTDAAAAVRQNLYEASALMGAKEATAFEFQVQKWLGSLYSVGFSKADSLADSFGKLAAGDISSITSGGFGNLLVMAANEAGIELGDALEQGLNDSQANALFKSMVDYLAGIYEDTKGSRVLAQEYAKVFDLTASDLKAAASLSKSVDTIAGHSQNYDSLLNQLHSMANSMIARTSTAEMMQNVMDNFTYTMAATLGNNPILYTLYNISNLLEGMASGIDIPFINIHGFGFDLNASVADLLKAATLGTTVLGGIGKLIGSLGSAGGFSGSGMLKSFGINKGLDVTSRGATAGMVVTPGADLSESGFVGNEKGDDVKKKTVDDASQEPEQQIAEAKEESEDVKLAQVDEHVVAIYTLLQDVVLGTKQFHVKLALGDVPNAWLNSATWN